MTTRLPAKPPPAATLRDLLDRECRALLTLHAKPRPELAAVINTVMHSTTNERVPLVPSARTDRITAWIGEHHDALRAIVAGLVVDEEHELAIKLSAGLLLLAPTAVNGDWVDRLARLATGDQDDLTRAVLWELGARCHIAAGRLTAADGLHTLEQGVMRPLRRADGSRPPMLPLLWRRTRLHWARGDHERALHWLNAIMAYLHHRPDPEQAQLRGIAHGEVLVAMGHHHDAVTVIERAVDLGPYPATVVARVDAHLTLGHVLHVQAGHQAAARRWKHARTALLAVLDNPPDQQFNTAVHDALATRLGHLDDLLSAAVDHPVRRQDFTVLGRPGGGHTPSTPEPDLTEGRTP
ncbi:hypothetical protein SUDANB95_07984 (plasmid) [Actinosynnema sp. ALI-1.44]